MRSLRDADKIQGWMTRTELKWLRGLALSVRPGARVFELGSWKGRSTVALMVDHIDLVCVDTWQGAPGDWTASLAAREDIFTIFSRNMRRLRLRPRIMRMDVIRAASLVPNGSLNVVFNDSDHDMYFRVHFWAWLEKLKRGGIYCGHDYSSGFPVVCEVLQSSGLEFGVVPGTSIWVLIKP